MIIITCWFRNWKKHGRRQRPGEIPGVESDPEGLGERSVMRAGIISSYITERFSFWNKGEKIIAAESWFGIFRGLRLYALPYRTELWENGCRKFIPAPFSRAENPDTQSRRDTAFCAWEGLVWKKVEASRKMAHLNKLLKNSHLKQDWFWLDMLRSKLGFFNKSLGN